ncbi:MAG: methionyl-tRNA formyltransferase [Nesterenkonia sp.]|uniref:methionyl-tRNA formyltransferase n=1 Tax=Nesterenkonia marinintestina TaxID=2979865 RepID=UPI0021BE8F68|nr:methionyl-tRNA formyltransferase [Nesterenkonia sp. GX14115]MDO5493924.1 methionyl-tRNA formyltransferase [Nesterenkonia sp.]
MQHFTAETLAAAVSAAPTGVDGRDPRLSGRPLVFAGTPAVAATALRRLHAAGAEFAAVLTRPDAPVGRRRRLTPSHVAQAAEELGLPVLRAERVDRQVTGQLARTGAELGVVVAYGALLDQQALEALPKGWVNLHFSALPAHRGAAPVQHTILAGDSVTAATVFQLDAGMDTGPIHGVCEHRLDPSTSAGQLLEELTDSGTDLLRVLLPDLLDGSSSPQPQQGTPSYAGKLGRADAYVDPAGDASEVVRRANATIPEPGAWTLHDGRRIKLGPLRRFDGSIPSAAPGAVMRVGADGDGQTPSTVMMTGSGDAVVLSAVQPEGRRMMEAEAWLRGQQTTVVLGTGHGSTDE